MSRILRTFVAIELPAAVRSAIAETQSQLRQELGDSAGRLRWVDVEGAHLTLKFLGATPEETVASIAEALGRELAGRPRCRLATAELGAFPTWRQPRVLWIGLAGDMEILGQTEAAVANAVATLGWAAEERPFHPHLTLARIRPEARPAERAAVGQALGHLWPPKPVSFEAKEVSLMLSEPGPGGSRYSRLAAIPLE